MNAATETRHRCAVPATHPALAGHFPGRPLLPAVLLLDLVLAHAAPHGEAFIARVKQAKFLRPLGPEQSFELICLRQGAHLRFRIERDGALAAQGDLELAPA